MVMDHAQESAAEFAQYTEVIQLMLGMLLNPEKRIRKVAAESIPYLLKSAKTKSLTSSS